jgi:beta-N-acetylhexosaminidase
MKAAGSSAFAQALPTFRRPPLTAKAWPTIPMPFRRFSKDAGWLMAAELRSVGVDFSFAPVLDVDSGISTIIGDRSFSRDAVTAARWASSFVQGMKLAGMAAVGKHFPGHGGVAPDSHIAFPVDSRSYAELDGRDLIPFKQLIASGIEGIMPAHVVYSALDERPAGFSPFWIHTVLRGRLGFSGAVFSDDLSMKAAELAGGWTERAEAALSAGCDMVLVCNNPEAADTVLDNLAWEPPPEHSRRLAAMAGRFAIDRDELLTSARWSDAVAAVRRVRQEVA